MTEWIDFVIYSLGITLQKKKWQYELKTIEEFEKHIYARIYTCYNGWILYVSHTTVCACICAQVFNFFFSFAFQVVMTPPFSYFSLIFNNSSHTFPYIQLFFFPLYSFLYNTPKENAFHNSAHYHPSMRILNRVQVNCMRASIMHRLLPLHFGTPLPSTHSWLVFCVPLRILLSMWKNYFHNPHSQKMYRQSQQKT